MTWAEKDKKADGKCQDDNNNPACDFDGGDCCPNGRWTGFTVDETYCTDCLCMAPY